MKLTSLSDLHTIMRESSPNQVATPKSGHDGKGNTVHLSLDTKGRKGKSVTIVSGLRHNPATMKEIARILKEACGTGGTVKGGDIELQGDQRERAAKELQKMNYIVV